MFASFRRNSFSTLAILLAIFLIGGNLLAPQSVAHAATFVVSKTADTADGTCDADCSLREAINAANINGVADTITFNPAVFNSPGTGTITLTSSLPQLSTNITITGPGTNSLFINGNNLWTAFQINAPASISNMTIRNTRADPALAGGAVFANANVTINSVAFLNNTAPANGGGAIWVNNGTTTIINSIFTGNSALGGGGGAALFVAGDGTASITNSSFNDNSATNGGAIAASGPLSITSSSFTDNTASADAGAILSGSNLQIISSTFSDNTSGDAGGAVLSSSNAGSAIVNSAFWNNSAVYGGALYNFGLLTITNSTITGNTASGDFGGGGVFWDHAGDVVTVNNTIIANNVVTSASKFGDDCEINGGTVNVYHTLTEEADGCINGVTEDNLTGDPALNPDLTLSEFSPAVNAGDNALISGYPTDLAGSTRIQQGTVDLGAYESPYTATLPEVSISPASANITEGTNNNFVLARSGSTTAALVVSLNITRGTNVAAGDYTLSGGSISGQNGAVTATIPAGSASVNINFAAVDDTLDEASETVTLAIASNASYTIGTPSSTIAIILDNDPTPTLSINDSSALEGNSGTTNRAFTVTLSPASGRTVTVNYATSNGTAVQPSDYASTSGTLTFAPGETTKTINVSVNGDRVEEADETFNVNLSTPTNATISDSVGVGTITNDDTAGFTVSPTTGLVTTEAGGTATFTVVLTSQPTADVTIGLSSSDTTEGNVSPTSLTFTAANWNVAQTVTVTGVDDVIVDGDMPYTILTETATSSDPFYNGLNPSNVSVTNNDNDAAGITVSPTSGLVTTEAGGTAIFTVVLTSEPTADVSIGLSSSDTTEGTPSPTSLTFTPANWNIAQTVTVTGVDDAVVDGSIAYTIVTAAATSADISYNGFNAADVSVTNTDNDAAGITVNPTSGLVTTEAGGTATFTVVLTSQPTADVTIGLSSSDTTEGNVSPTSLTFTSANWNVAQTVTVTGADDSVVDGSIAYTIVTAAATSSDAIYNGFNAADVGVTNTDNDAVGITVNPMSGLVTTEAGGTANFTVVLTSQPTADVTIGLSSSDTTEGTPSPTSLTFTSANWNVAQTVTVTGVDDALIDGDVAYTIVTAAATSADASYNGFNAVDVGVTNSDNDIAGVTVNPTSGLVTTEAGGTATFTVVLTSQPSADVTIGLSSSDTTEGMPSPTSLTFTAANWNVAQTVTVTGVDDSIADGDIAYTIVTAAATSGDANYNGFNAADVSVTNQNDDVVGITVNPTSGLITTEAGSTANFTVVLTSQPMADVTIGLSSSDTTEGNVSPTSVTFTTANWNVAQTVTVTGVDDSVADGDIAYTIVTAAATSADVNYNGFNAADVSAINQNNDVAGVTVSPPSGLVTTEAGGTATFTVVLTSEPTADVTIGLSSSDTTEGTPSPTSLTFTAANWNVAQTVTVTGVDDAVVDGNIGYSITFVVSSGDGDYAGFTVAAVSVTNTDDDSAGIVIDPISGLATGEDGSTASFTVVLTSEPTADVTIGLSSSDTTEGTVSPISLTFTAADWNVVQTVTVTGVDDGIADGDIAYSIVTAAAVSTDANYGGVDPADVSVTNTDDDSAGVNITPTSLTMQENDPPQTYHITVGSEPSAPFTLAISFDTTQIVVNGSTTSPVILNLTSAGTVDVTVEAPENTADNNNRVTLITHAIISSSAPEYPTSFAVSGVTVNIGDVPPPPPIPTCETHNFDEGGVVRTGIPDALSYAINCRVMYQNGVPTTWMGNALYSEANLGVEGLVSLGIETAVDIFSPPGLTYFEGGAVFCVRGSGTLIWFAASHAPRTAEIIGSYTVPEFSGFTCATLFEPGTLVLVRNEPN